MASDHLTARQAAAALGLYREAVPQLARYLDLGERGPDGRWRFHRGRIEALSPTGLVRALDPNRCVGAVHGRR